MYKIFINDKPLFLADNQAEYSANETSLLIDYHGEDDLIYGIQALEERESIASVMIINSDLERLWNAFKSRFKIIEAAGGLVKNENGDYLLIFRNGKWDLPKGKLEKSETTEDAALREVAEECGITNMRIEAELPNTYHTYVLKGKNILKVSFWFAMSYSGDETPSPQLNEGITKVEWLDSEHIKVALTNAYSSVKEMLISLNKGDSNTDPDSL